MVDSSSQSAVTRRVDWLLYLSFLCITVGAKFWLISVYSNATPYSDQWDAEAALLYKPLLEGTLNWADLFDSHNEHRILSTRLLALAVFMANDIWNPVLQMAINAILHALAILLCTVLLVKIVGRRWLPILTSVAALLLVIPTGWHNTLAGFQSSFYFLILFSFAALWLIVTSPPLGWQWWLGITFSLLSYFSLASGMITLAVIAFTAILLYCFDDTRNKQQLIAVLLLLGLFAVCFAFFPSIDQHQDLKADSFRKFLTSLAVIWSWPLSSLMVLGPLLQGPALFFCLHMLKLRPPADDRRWFLFALAVWCTAQAVALAYGRAALPLASRYTDLFALGILTNLACLLYFSPGKFPLRIICAAGAWLLLLMAGLGWQSMYELPKKLLGKQLSGRNHAMACEAYISTGDIETLSPGRSSLAHIPYPSAERLAAFLDDQTIRSLLPAKIREQLLPVAEPGTIHSSNQTIPAGDEKGELLASSDYTNATGNTSAIQSMRFLADPNEARWIAFNFYGDLNSESTMLGIEQQGKPLRYRVKKSPQKQGQYRVISKVPAGIFTIAVVNINVDKDVTISAPTVIGAFDPQLDTALEMHLGLIFLGCGLLLFRVYLGQNLTHSPNSG